MASQAAPEPGTTCDSYTVVSQAPWSLPIGPSWCSPRHLSVVAARVLSAAPPQLPCGSFSQLQVSSVSLLKAPDPWRWPLQAPPASPSLLLACSLRPSLPSPCLPRQAPGSASTGAHPSGMDGWCRGPAAPGLGELVELEENDWAMSSLCSKHSCERESSHSRLERRDTTEAAALGSKAETLLGSFQDPRLLVLQSPPRRLCSAFRQLPVCPRASRAAAASDPQEEEASSVSYFRRVQGAHPGSLGDCGLCRLE